VIFIVVIRYHIVGLQGASATRYGLKILARYTSVATNMLSQVKVEDMPQTALAMACMRVINPPLGFIFLRCIAKRGIIYIIE